MSNDVLLVDASGEIMPEQQKGNDKPITWEGIGRWALTGVVLLFLWFVNNQAGELKASILSLNQSVQETNLSMERRLTKLETLQALQVNLCK